MRGLRRAKGVTALLPQKIAPLLGMSESRGEGEGYRCVYPRFTQTDFTCVYCSRAAWPDSRP